MTPRPTFTLRDLQRLSTALWYAQRERIDNIYSVTRRTNTQAARDAAAFARLRGKVQAMIDGRGKAGGGR